jgi:hypothetical protein
VHEHAGREDPASIRARGALEVGDADIVVWDLTGAEKFPPPLHSMATDHLPE